MAPFIVSSLNFVARGKYGTSYSPRGKKKCYALLYDKFLLLFLFSLSTTARQKARKRWKVRAWKYWIKTLKRSKHATDTIVQVEFEVTRTRVRRYVERDTRLFRTFCCPYFFFNYLPPLRPPLFNFDYMFEQNSLVYYLSFIFLPPIRVGYIANHRRTFRRQHFIDSGFDWNYLSIYTR